MSIRVSLSTALLVLGMAFAAAAGAPSERKVAEDVTRYWNKQWPDQEVAHVTRSSTACEAGELEQAVRGKLKKFKTCLLKTDVFISRGYRLFIYRSTEVHYQGAKLLSVQLGELEKAWKAGGVPKPTPEQAAELLSALASERLGTQAKLTVVELGRPRPFGETYRLSVLLNATFQDAAGQQQTRSKLLATLDSDGGPWRPIPELTF